MVELTKQVMNGIDLEGGKGIPDWQSGVNRLKKMPINPTHPQELFDMKCNCLEGSPKT